jgi:hypothetical protein
MLRQEAHTYPAFWRGFALAARALATAETDGLGNAPAGATAIVDEGVGIVV